MSLPSSEKRWTPREQGLGFDKPKRTMCGILAALWREGQAPEDRRRWALEAAAGAVARRGPDGIEAVAPAEAPVVICASVLRMRSGEDWRQPAVDSATGVVLAWNGEWFGCFDERKGDTARVLELVARTAGTRTNAAEARSAIASALAEAVRGPYALVVWLPAARCLVYGRDPFGRRSLLATTSNDRVALASVSPTKSRATWSEVPTTGLEVARLEAGGVELLPPEPWPRAPFLDAASWPIGEAQAVEARLGRGGVRPKAKESLEAMTEVSRQAAAAALLATLSEAVRRRTVGVPPPVAVLFSGGIDSAVLAALCDRHAPPDQPIELINVAFGARGAQDAPDRLAARATLAELRTAAPRRDWRLVEVSVEARGLRRSAARVVALAAPSDTHMDFNIAAALRHAAHATGELYEGGQSTYESGLLRYADQLPRTTEPERGKPRTCLGGSSERPCTNRTHPKCARGLCGNCCRRKAAGDAACRIHPRRLGPKEKAARTRPTPVAPVEEEEEAAVNDEGFAMGSYSSESRVLVVGMGADELLAGYSRHRTAWRRGGATALGLELDLDVARIARRNLGRDDRVMADAGREARFPFLDEDVVALVRTRFPLPVVADLDQPPGLGCKRVLRDVARLLDLPECARLQKRAIQFGTRIATHSNKLAFGSNRRADGAANFDLATLQAGAGREEEEDQGCWASSSL